jgi:hypothetical protein
MQGSAHRMKLADTRRVEGGLLVHYSNDDLSRSSPCPVTRTPTSIQAYFDLLEAEIYQS